MCRFLVCFVFCCICQVSIGSRVRLSMTWKMWLHVCVCCSLIEQVRDACAGIITTVRLTSKFPELWVLIIIKGSLTSWELIINDQPSLPASCPHSTNMNHYQLIGIGNEPSIMLNSIKADHRSESEPKLERIETAPDPGHSWPEHKNTGETQVKHRHSGETQKHRHSGETQNHSWDTRKTQTHSWRLIHQLTGVLIHAVVKMTRRLSSLECLLTVISSLLLVCCVGLIVVSWNSLRPEGDKRWVLVR